MKHIFEFEGFLNEGVEFAKEVNLLDPKYKERGAISCYSYIIPIDPKTLMDQIKLKNGIPWTTLEGSSVNPANYQLKGITYKILNTNTIQFTFPAGQFTDSERAIIRLEIPGLVDPKFPKRKFTVFGKFDFPKKEKKADGSVNVTRHPNAGKVYTSEIPRNVPGGKLKVIIDLKKCTKG